MSTKIIKMNDCDYLDYNNLKNLEFDIIFYDYHYGSYCGDGNALVCKNGKWGYVTLSHCSCYDAYDNLAGANCEFKDPRDIEKKASTELFDFIDNCIQICEDLGLFEFKSNTMLFTKLVYEVQEG
jgi:hypothetical protein